jgi:hypothetical protein
MPSNYTPIATGAAGNASVVNTPLGQLDTAIGTLTALNTTAKTSTVAAINEIAGINSSLSDAFTELDANVGNVAGMNTTNKVVAPAINELYNSIHGVIGGATVTGNQLIAWAEAEAYQLASITYDGTYTSVIASGNVLWPDGSVGVFTTDTINTTWLAIDAYHITHTTSGKTVTQTAVTRNADGNVTAKPNLSVA